MIYLFIEIYNIATQLSIKLYNKKIANNLIVKSNPEQFPEKFFRMRCKIFYTVYFVFADFVFSFEQDYIIRFKTSETSINFYK